MSRSSQQKRQAEGIDECQATVSKLDDVTVDFVRRQNKANFLHDIAAVQRTLENEFGAFDTRADVTAVQKQYCRLHV